MIKKRISILLVIVLILGNTAGSMAASVDERLSNYNFTYENQSARLMKIKSSGKAEQVKLVQDLKVLRGTSKGLELDKALTRAEAAAVYYRLIGGKWPLEGYSTGFDDIPEWAEKTINFLHQNGYVKGISPEKYGSNEYMTADQFTTMILRGLGYKDSKGEFVWNESLEKAVELGILTQKEKEEIQKDELFTRGEMVTIAYNSLFTNLKDSSELLIHRSVAIPNEDFGKMFYVTLNSEELEEFKKASGEEEYSIFPDDPEKKQAVLDKIQEYFDKCNEIYKIYVNDEELNIAVTSVNDAGNLSFFDYWENRDKIFSATVQVDSPFTDKAEFEHYFWWRLDGNKLKSNSDIDYFGAYTNGLILEIIRGRVDEFLYLPNRYDWDSDVEGLEDFREENQIEPWDAKRRFYYYDDKKMVDSITIKRKGSLDQHLYIEVFN